MDGKSQLDQVKELEGSVKRWRNFVIVVFVALALSYFIWFGYRGEPLGQSSAIWGSFGDFIGGILNPIIAFCAFYWLVQSVIIQKTELAETRIALEASQRAQDDQAKTLSHQRFDSTFFALLQQLNNVLSELNTTPPPKPEPKDRVAAMLFRRDLKSPIRETHIAVFGQHVLGEARVVMEEHNGDCGHYFRTLYQLLKFVAMKCPGSLVGSDFTIDALRNTETTTEEKFYANIVRSFLNYDVTRLLAINAAVTDGADTYYKFKLLVDRYALLEHMPFSVVEGGPDHPALHAAAKCFTRRAFGNSEFIDSEILKELPLR